MQGLEARVRSFRQRQNPERELFEHQRVRWAVPEIQGQADWGREARRVLRS